MLTQRGTAHAHLFFFRPQLSTNGPENGDRHGRRCQRSESNSNRSAIVARNVRRPPRGQRGGPCARYTFLSNHKVTVTIRINECPMSFKGAVGTPTVVSGRGHCSKPRICNPAPRPFPSKPGQPSKLQETWGTATPPHASATSTLDSPIPLCSLHDVEVLR